MSETFDLLVIGSGPGGMRAAVQAAKLRKTVAVIEMVPDQLGGAWIHTGTIPSKTLRETVLNLTGWRERGFYGRAHRNKADITAEDLRREHEDVFGNQTTFTEVETPYRELRITSRSLPVSATTSSPEGPRVRPRGL